MPRTRSLPLHLALPLVAACSASARPITTPHTAPAAALPTAPTERAFLTGRLTYDSGAPLADATVVLEELTHEEIIARATTDRDGRYRIDAPLGVYAMTVAGADSFSWTERFDPSTPLTPVTQTCHAIAGHADGASGQARVIFKRHDRHDYLFVRPVSADGSFAACLPSGLYEVSLDGDTQSPKRFLALTAPAKLHLRGFSTADVQRPPPAMPPPRANLQNLVDDVLAQHPALIGLGEGTYGTREFYTTRGELTLALIRQAGVRLLLFEFDALASDDLDRYINGDNIDLAKALPALRFWITDVYEFRDVLGQLRAYNATATDKVHLRGIDLQDTTLPVDALLSRAASLQLTPEHQALLKRLSRRGAGIRELSTTERATVDALLARLSTPTGHTPDDDRVALAARSLALQLEYWNGDLFAWYTQHHEAGMAELARLLLAQANGPRAVLWAHDVHVAKGDDLRLGGHLAHVDGGYYAVGSYAYQGEARAWDPDEKIGVVPHRFGPAADTDLEGAITRATNARDVAWLPLHSAPAPLRQWLTVPRWTNSFGQAFLDIRELRDIVTSFDALIIVHTSHPTTPTPTGVRVAKQ